jgi:hypothetical protein
MYIYKQIQLPYDHTPMQSVTTNAVGMYNGQKNEKEKDKQWSTKHYAKKIKIEKHEPH